MERGQFPFQQHHSVKETHACRQGGQQTHPARPDQQALAGEQSELGERQSVFPPPTNLFPQCSERFFRQRMTAQVFLLLQAWALQVSLGRGVCWSQDVRQRQHERDEMQGLFAGQP